MNLAWIDLETTGTHPEADRIIEVGLVVTNQHLETLLEGSWTVGPPDTLCMTPTVAAMHARNGLLEELSEVGGPPLADIDHDLVSVVGPYLKGGRIILAGSGVAHFDRKFIDAQLPELAKRLTYYTIDVGVIRRFMDKVVGAPKPADYPTPDGKTHRALDDIRLHVDEARSWRDHLQVQAQPATVPRGL